MAMEYILIFFLIFITSYFVVGKWKGKSQSVHRYPPSLPCLPLIGSLPFLRKFDNISKFFMEKSDQLGPLFTFRVGSKLILTLNNREVIEEALVKNSRSFSSRPKMFLQKITDPHNKGIFFIDGLKGKRIQQCSLSILREFGFGVKNVMEERIQEEVEAVIEYARGKQGEPFDPKKLAMLMTSNVLMNIMFGSRRNYDLGISELVNEIDRNSHNIDVIFDIAPFLRIIPKFRQRITKIKECTKNIYDLVDREVDKSLQTDEIDFISEYIKREGSSFDRDQLNFVLRDLFAAGTETTSTTFRWSLVVLANRPEIQKRLQEDIDSVIPRDRLPSLQDQAKLPYVEATILELYRWRTLVPLSLPHRVEQDSDVRNYFIPAGTLVLPNLYAAHSHPSVWKDPDVFRPERFLHKEGKVIGRDRVIPFSLGRRSCIGEILARSEIFLFLTSLLQRFITLPPEGQDKICDQPRVPVNIVTMPRPFTIRLLERR